MYEHCVDERGHTGLESLRGSTSECGLLSANIPLVSLGDCRSGWNVHTCFFEVSNSRFNMGQTQFNDCGD